MQTAQRDTIAWLERAVIGLNLCPFAKAVHVKGQVHLCVSDARTEADLLAELRRELADRYGEKKLYEGGLSVRTTLDPKMQLMARKALTDGLVRYDEAHGWRGAIQRATRVNGRVMILISW